MKTTTYLKLGALAAGTYGVIRAVRQLAPQVSGLDAKFDSSDVTASEVQDISAIQDTTDVDVPMVVTEEVVVISDVGPYEVELELIPDNDRSSRR